MRGHRNFTIFVFSLCFMPLIIGSSPNKLGESGPGFEDPGVPRESQRDLRQAICFPMILSISQDSLNTITNLA